MHHGTCAVYKRALVSGAVRVAILNEIFEL